MRRKRLFIGVILAASVLLGLFLGDVARAVHYLPPQKYGQAFTLHFSIYDSNSPWQYYETAPAADDVYVRIDGGAAARATNAVTDLDHTMSLVLTAAEMTGSVITIDVNDETAPPLFGSDTWVIYTHGHASAQNAFDLDSATVTPGADSITASVIADNAIDAAAIATDAITAAKIADGAIDAGAIASNAITAAKIATDAFTSDELATSFIDEILDNTLTNNKIKHSLAWWVQKGGGGDPLELTGTAQAGGTTNTIVLAADTPGGDDAFSPCSVTLLSGTGAWAIRTGVAYNSTSKVLTILDTWPGSSPDATTSYKIEYAPTSALAAEGVAQGGTANTIQLASGDVSVDNLTGLIQLVSGTGSGSTIYSVRDSYDANDTLVITGNWSGASPDTTTYYKFTPAGGQVSDSSTGSTLTVADITNALDQQGMTTTLTANLAAMDTQNELRTLLTGGTNAVLTTANLPANFSSLSIDGSGNVAATATVTVDGDLLTWLNKIFLNLP